MEGLPAGSVDLRRPSGLPKLPEDSKGDTGNPVSTPSVPKMDASTVDPVNGDSMAPGELPPKEVMSPKQPEPSTELKAVLGILQTLTHQDENLTKKNEDYSEQLVDLKEKLKGIDENSAVKAEKSSFFKFPRGSLDPDGSQGNNDNKGQGVVKTPS